MIGDSSNQSKSAAPVKTLLVDYCWPYAHLFGVSILSMLVARALWMFPAVVFGAAVDGVFTGTRAYTLPLIPATVIPESRIGQFWFSIGTIGGSFLFGSLVYVVGSWARSAAAYRVQHELRTDAYETAQGLSMTFFDSESTGDVMSVLNNDVNQLESFLNDTLQQAANAVFILVVVGGYMLLLNWQLALVAFLAPVLVAGVNYWYSRYVEPRYRSIRQAVADVNDAIETNLSGITVIKTYTKEKQEKERIEEVSDQYRQASWVVSKMRILTGQVTGRLSNVGYILVFLTGGLWIINGPMLWLSGTLTAGTLTTFIIYNNQFQWPMRQLTSIVDSYQEAKAASGRVLDLFEQERDSRSEEIPVADGGDIDFRGPITFENVQFSYDDETPVFENLSLEIEPGETVGVIGTSGVGKSTIIKLLLHFYNTDQGEITIDDVRTDTIRTARLRSHVGYVGQESFLFDRSIKDNILFGGDDAELDRDRLERAVRTSGATDFVALGPDDDGYDLDTEVGDEGNELSAGQRQRITLARALYSDPEILVLDEATSHVDSMTELAIQRGMTDIVADRTTIIVAHRLSMVREADKILILGEDGIADTGTHQELIEESGLYSDLWNAQTGNRDALTQKSH
ncbi:MAG: ABC transporter ATP-binding protein [Halobaculum sp.]